MVILISVVINGVDVLVGLKLSCLRMKGSIELDSELKVMMLISVVLMVSVSSV